MASPLKRGQSGNQVTNQFPSTAKHTPSDGVSTFVPHGLRLRQTITSSGSVTIPAGINWVYVIMTSGGGGSYFGFGGNGGHLAWGWTLARNTCIIGAGGTIGGNGGYTRYGHIIATGVATRGANSGQTNYYAQPGGAAGGGQSATPVNGGIGANAGSGQEGNTSAPTAGSGGNGISGGGGANTQYVSGPQTAGNGGNGIIGGGGGDASSGIGTILRTAGNGGNGIGIDGTIYTGGAGVSRTDTSAAGGGGAGIAGNGSNGVGNSGGAGGLGGGGGGAPNGTGGAGILYIFY